MRSKKRISLFAILSTMFLAASNFGCASGQSAPPPPPPISVSVSPSAVQSVDQGQTTNFTANVVNDSANKGVAWTVSCSTAPCGTVSPTATPSGAPATYTAPSSVAANLNVTVTAASVADSTKSAPGLVTVMALSVTVAPNTVQTVDQGQTVNFSASTVNDPTTKGLTWSVSCSTPPCGTVLPSATASGAATTYTAPNTVAANRSMTITATSVADSAKSAPGSVTVMALSVSVAPSTPQSVDQGQTANFTATVANDSTNKGVQWTVSCAKAPCGAVSPTTTSSGAATTYTAPVSVSANLPVTVTAASVADPTKTASAPINIPGITVTVSPSTATLQTGGAAQFTATVTNDGVNKGVTWTVSCPAAPCGTVSPAATASGSATTYTAPTTPPAGNLAVTLTASSVTNGAASASATITVPTITVSVTPTTATLQAGAKTQFTAMVTNDGATKGVTWIVSCSAASCGTVSPTATASGVATTYTAPATPPAVNLTVTLTAASVTFPAATASATITISGITVSIAPSSAAVPSGGTQQFIATVTNDPSNGGVNWGLNAAYRVLRCIVGHCTQTGVAFLPCTSACGLVSPASTASGASTTYTAPAHFTPPPGPPTHCMFFVCTFYSFSGVFIQASSVTNNGSFSRAAITILPISVSVAPSTANVALSGMQQFTATVANDGTNSGVTWTLTQNGAACSPGCGTIAPASTASAAPVTYTAPATAPALPVVTVTATSVADTTKSGFATATLTTSTGSLACGAGSGSESLLKGQYAFRVQGFDSNGGVPTVGSFNADGTGKILGGEEDIGSGSDFSIDATASSYSVGPDHRGCVTLAIVNSSTTYFRFAVGSINSSNIAATGHILEFFDTGRTGTLLAGTFRLQDAASFAATRFKGNYAVGLSGTDTNSARLAIAGTFTSDGVSAITANDFDINDAGTISSNVSSASGGSFTCCSPNGRGTLQISASSFSVSLAIYMINSSDAFLVNIGPGSYSGEAIAAPGPFSISSLNGAAVLRKTAQSSTGPIVDIATASANGNGAITVTDNENNAGTFTTNSTALNYLVAPNGRVTIAGGSNPPVIYLYGQNQGFLVGTDANVEFGYLEPQAAGPFNDASLSGAYMFGTENPSAASVTLESGVANLDGKGNVTGTSDQSNSTGLTQNQSLSLTYSVSANGTGTFGSGTTAIFISGNKLVFINNASATPTITVVEK